MTPRVRVKLPLEVADIQEVLRGIAGERPVFHSEADFQHAFAWRLHGLLPTASIRLEVPVRDGDASVHVDVRLSKGDSSVVFELKYKTRRVTYRVSDEQYLLANHSAQDCGRYDFVKDIGRLEKIVAGNAKAIGYVILLTNDSAYWKAPQSQGTVDAAFRLHEGRPLGGSLAWGTHASAGTKKGRESPIDLRGTHTLLWQDYSGSASEACGVFRYLAVRVVP